MLNKIKREFNDERNAQRVSNIPLSTEIFLKKKRIFYKNKDWSATGIGLLKNNKNEKNPFKKNKVYEANIVLYTKGSITLLKVKIKYKNCHKDTYGFAFEEISEANKRTIRNYISNIIEGNINTIETISSDLAMPEIPNPTEEIISLDSDHKLDLKKGFLKKTYFNITIAVIFIILLIMTIFYNYSVDYIGNGISTGNYLKYKIPLPGTILKITKHKEIKKGDFLYSYRVNLIKSELNDKINIYKIKKLELNNKLKNYIYEYNLKRNNNLAEIRIINNDLLNLNNELKNAIKLYRQHIILKNVLDNIKKQIEIKKNSLSKLTNNELYNKIKILKEEIRNLNKYDNFNIVNNQINKVFSIKPGKIHSIKVKEEELVKQNQLILITETKEKSNIIINIPRKDMNNIKINSKVLIKYNNNYYRGYISSLGYSSTTTNTNSTMEVSLKDTIVKINFNKYITLPLNSIVEIKIFKNSFFTNFFIKLYSWNNDD